MDITVSKMCSTMFVNNGLILSVSCRMGKRSVGIDILRILCSFVVVLFHVQGKVEGDNYISKIITPLIIIAMALFTFISGWFYAEKLIENDSIKVIVGKFNRTWLQYLIFVPLTIWGCGGRLTWNMFLDCNFWHLWYLPMLFMCFVITYFIRIPLRNSFVAIGFLIFLILLQNIEKPPHPGLNNVRMWHFFFVLGYIYRNIENRFIDKNIYAPIVLILLYVIGWAIFPFYYRIPSIYATIITGIGCVGIFFLMKNFIPVKDKYSCIIHTIAKNSFGVYLIHFLIMVWMLSSTSYRLLNLHILQNSISVTGFIVLVSIGVYIISWLITQVMIKCKIGRIVS